MYATAGWALIHPTGDMALGLVTCQELPQLLATVRMRT